MQAAGRTSRPWVVVILAGAFYAAVGVVFAWFGPELLWRRLAWVVSALAFGAHLAYEHFRCGSPAGRLALRVSAAAAVGAFGLAVAANIHGWTSASAHHRSLLVALVAWPVLVGIPACVVAWIAAVIARRAWPGPPA